MICEKTMAKFKFKDIETCPPFKTPDFIYKEARHELVNKIFLVRQEFKWVEVFILRPLESGLEIEILSIENNTVFDENLTYPIALETKEISPLKFAKIMNVIYEYDLPF